MALEFYQLTLKGDREVNQDSMAHLVTERYALFVVADGLGGHQAGEKASRFFCQSLLRFAHIYAPQVAQQPVEAFSAWTSAAIDEMKRLFAFDMAGQNAHTTCAILYLDEHHAITAHCGDSRIYRMSPQRILWRTKDHSVPQQLLDEGRITEQQMAQHPEQNRLTRSINILKGNEVEINLYPPMKKGETFVLCSDGFWEYVKPEELIKLAIPATEREELLKLTKLAVLRAHGHSDNVTVQWLRKH
ncbi:MAG: PP2C family protein-serine/threonine phosphatase [Methylobacter sp.]